MRRIFEQRARIVVYVESADMDRMTAVARSEGKTLIEWARETLLENVEEGDNSGLRRAEEVLPVERGVAASERPAVPVEKPKAGTCRHGKRKGEVCYKCDTKWGYPEVKG